MDCVADTNIWLRISQPEHAQSARAIEAVTHLLRNRDEVYLLPQVMVEYWRVATGNAEGAGYSLPAWG